MATRRAAVQAMAASEGTGGKARSFPTAPGLRPDGWSLTVQRALAVTPEAAWEMFATAARVSDWFGARHRHDFREGGRWQRTGSGHGVIRRIVPYRYIGFTWEARGLASRSAVDVEFRIRGESSVTVKLTHRRIRDAADRDVLRAMWSRAMDAMKAYVESQVPTAEPIVPERAHCSNGHAVSARTPRS
jgi:uncharacterized protein YndB with AHSA1/START domain